MFSSVTCKLLNFKWQVCYDEAITKKLTDISDDCFLEAGEKSCSVLHHRREAGSAGNVKSHSGCVQGIWIERKY